MRFELTDRFHGLLFRASLPLRPGHWFAGCGLLSGLLRRARWLSQVPVQPLAPLPRSQTPPVQRCQTALQLRCSVPVQNKAEDHPVINLSRLNHAALTLAAYASRFDCSTRARLASGCAVSLSRTGFRVPLPPQGHFRKISVQLPSLPSSPGFSLARYSLF